MTDPGTPTWLRTHNDRAAFRLMLEHGPLSRSRLGELSGMSKPTAGQMIARLERVGLVGPAGEVTGARGPSAVAWGVRPDSRIGVAMSVLEDEIEAVVVDPTGADHPVAVLRVGTDRSPVADVEAAVRAACGAAGIAPGAVSGVVIGVQASFDVAADRLSLTDTLPGWPECGARAELVRETGLEVVIENDVNLAALAEGAATGLTDFAYLWLGAGLGAGIRSGGVLHTGSAGSAGEIGYLEAPRSAASIDPDALDLTDLAGGPALIRLLGAASFPDAVAALPGNEAALASLAERVALVIEPLCAVTDPALVVLGGPTAQAGGERLAALVQERVTLRRPVPVVAGRAGDRPVLLGARRLLLDTIRQHLEETISAMREDNG